MEIVVIMYALVALMGILVGSFLNVCILRIPKGESVVTTPSHCFSCDKKLHWWELFPLFSWLALGGKCSACKAKISAQYPIIEATNGLLWMLIFHVYGLTATFGIGCALVSALLVLSVIDARTREIPPQTTIFIAILGVIRILTDTPNFTDYLFGCLAITLFTGLLFFLSGGGVIGFGDVKLMFGCGLILGLAPTILSFFIACIIGSVIHIIKMLFFGARRDLAMGPYLAVGVFICFLWGNNIVDWYLNIIGF